MAAVSNTPNPLLSPTDYARKEELVISDTDISALSSTLSARALVLLPNHPQYETYRGRWNKAFIAKPTVALAVDMLKLYT